MAHIKLPNSSFKFLPQGAIIQEFQVAGRNLVVSFSNPEQYLQTKNHYFGETIGRIANRVSNGLIENLNGRSYQLTTNLGPDHLHGGIDGWGRKTFSGPEYVTRDGRGAIQYTYVSPDNEEGYPGTVELRVWYTAHEVEKNKVILEIEYEAELVGDECEETIINITNHTYFNLGTSSTVEGTEISLATNRFLAVDDNRMPTGEISEFEGIDADQPFTLGASQPQVDHCFVMDEDLDNMELDTRGRKMRTIVTAHNTSTGISLEVSSSEPSFQFYTGDYVNVPASEHESAKPARAGFCVEPGRFVNAINMPRWRGQVVLRRGRVWGSRIAYKAIKA